MLLCMPILVSAADDKLPAEVQLCSSCGDRYWHPPVESTHVAWMASGMAPSSGQPQGQA